MRRWNSRLLFEHSFAMIMLLSGTEHTMNRTRQRIGRPARISSNLSREGVVYRALTAHRNTGGIHSAAHSVDDLLRARRLNVRNPSDAPSLERPHAGRAADTRLVQHERASLLPVQAVAGQPTKQVDPGDLDSNYVDPPPRPAILSECFRAQVAPW